MLCGDIQEIVTNKNQYHISAHSNKSTVTQHWFFTMILYLIYVLLFFSV